MKRYFSLSIVAILALGANMYAKDVDSNTTSKLDTISIVSKSLGYSDVDSSKISLNQASLLSQTLRDVPGIYVGGTNGISQQINMRGVTDRGLNITIDGAKQKGNSFHHVSNFLLDPELLKQIDASVGVNSVTQGSGALGGSVAFTTVDASDLLQNGQKVGFKVKTGYGSNNNESGKSVTLYGQAFDILDVLGYVKQNSHDFGETGGGTQVGGDGNDLSVLLKLGVKLTDSQKIHLSYNKMKYYGNYPLRANMGFTASSPMAYDVFDRDTYTFDYNINQNDFLNLNLNAYYTKEHFDSKYTMRGSAGEINNNVITQGGLLKNTSKFSFSELSNTFNYGVEYYTTKAEDITSGNDKERANAYTVYLEDQIRYEGFTLTPGVKYDYAKLKSFYGSTATDRTFGEKDFHDFSASITGRYDFDFGLGLFAGYTQLYRTPDVIEALRIKGDYSTDPDLEAETGDNKEVGISYKTSLTDTISFDAMVKYYKTKYDNTITEHGTGGVVSVYRENTGAVEIDGYEALANFYVQDLKLGAGYSSSDVDRAQKTLDSTYGAVIGKEVGDKYTLNTEYYFSQLGLTAGWNTLFVKSKDVTTVNTNKTTKVKSFHSYTKPSYAVNDLYAQWQPNNAALKGVTLTFGVYNIFDKDYVSHTSFGSIDTDYADGEPGRNVKVSFSYRY